MENDTTVRFVNNDVDFKEGSKEIQTQWDAFDVSAKMLDYELSSIAYRNIVEVSAMPKPGVNKENLFMRIILEDSYHKDDIDILKAVILKESNKLMTNFVEEIEFYYDGNKHSVKTSDPESVQLIKNFIQQMNIQIV